PPIAARARSPLLPSTTLFRSGYGNPRVTNERYRRNLGKGQTGLSIAFDLPTQTGYDSDHPMARGEVGRVGVPICHLGDMLTVFEDRKSTRLNSSHGSISYAVF